MKMNRKIRSNIHVKILAIFFLLLFSIANFKNIFKSEFYVFLNKIIIWGGGAVLIFFYLIPMFRKKIKIPIEFILYSFLLILSLFGLTIIISLPFFLKYFQALLSNLVIMLIIYRIVSTIDDFVLIIKYLWLASLFSTIFGFLFELEFMNNEYYRLSGLLGNANGTANVARVGILFSFLILFLMNQKYKIVYIFSIVFYSYVIIITASRGAFINLLFISIIVLVYYVFKSERKFLTIPLFLIVSLILIFFIKQFKSTYLFDRLFKEDSIEKTIEADTRTRLYNLSIETIKENPILGVGLNQFRFHSGGYISHSDFIGLTAQLGLIAGFVYFLIYYFLFERMIMFMPLVKTLLSPIINVVFMVIFFSELFYGLTNANWFSQIQMVILGLTVTFYAKIIPNEYLQVKS